MRGFFKAGFAAVIAAVCFFLSPLADTVYAFGGDETLVLSGSVKESVVVDTAIKKVVFKNVQMEEGTVLTVNSPVEIEIKEGLENRVHLLDIENMTAFTGAGTLFVTGGVLVNETELLFNHTGSICIGGPLSAANAEIILNSGSLSLENEKEGVSGIGLIGGSFTVNGGILSVNTAGAAIAAIGKVEINGGTVNTVSESGAAIMASDKDGGGIFISDAVSVREDVTVSAFEGENGTYESFTAADGNPASGALLEGPDDEEAKLYANEEFEAKSDKAVQIAKEKAEKARQEAEAEKKKEEITSSEKKDTAPDEKAEGSKDKSTEKTVKMTGPQSGIIVIVIIAAIAAVSSAVIMLSQRRKNK